MILGRHSPSDKKILAARFTYSMTPVKFQTAVKLLVTQSVTCRSETYLHPWNANMSNCYIIYTIFHPTIAHWCILQGEGRMGREGGGGVSWNYRIVCSGHRLQSDTKQAIELFTKESFQ